MNSFKDMNKKYNKNNSNVKGNFYLFADSKTQRLSCNKYKFSNTGKAEEWFKERMTTSIEKKEESNDFSEIEKSLSNTQYVEKVIKDYLDREFSTPLFEYQ